MKIGDTVTRRPETFGECDEAAGKKMRGVNKTMTGTVIYIHPSGRYHTVEFAVSGGTVRESFLGV